MDEEPTKTISDLTTLTMTSTTAVAFIVAILRGLYDRKEPSFIRVLLEASVCSGISISAIALLFVAFPQLTRSIEIAVIAGGGCGAFIGFLGVHQLRQLLIKFLQRKAK